MPKTRSILNTFTCEVVLINFKAWERLNFDISYRELIELIEIRVNQKESNLCFKSKIRQVNSIKNQLQHKGFIKRADKFPKRYELSDIGWNCLRHYSRNITNIFYERNKELRYLTELE